MCKLLFGVLFVAASFTCVATADDQADAKVILDAAIKATGGEAALEKPVAFYFKFKEVQYDGDKKTLTTGEWFLQGHDQERAVSFDEDGKTTEIVVLNGKDGWSKEADQPAERLSDEQLEYQQEMVFLNWVTMLAPLKGKEFRLATSDETTVGDRKAVGITVTQEKHRPVTLYFDKESHLLVKWKRKLKDPDTSKEVDEECVFSDFRDVQGTKQPFKAEVTWDGAKVMDLTVTEAKLHEKPLDDKLFEKP
jgi:hypothetical protein